MSEQIPDNVAAALEKLGWQQEVTGFALEMHGKMAQMVDALKELLTDLDHYTWYDNFVYQHMLKAQRIVEAYTEEPFPLKNTERAR